MFWSLFIFCRHSTRAPASIFCDAGLPSLFCGSTQEPALATANTGKTQKTFWGKWWWMDQEGRNYVRIPWQFVEHAWLYSDLVKAFKGETWNSGFSVDGSLIFASKAPSAGGWLKCLLKQLIRRNRMLLQDQIYSWCFICLVVLAEITVVSNTKSKQHSACDTVFLIPQRQSWEHAG